MQRPQGSINGSVVTACGEEILIRYLPAAREERSIRLPLSTLLRKDILPRISKRLTFTCFPNF